MAMKLLRYIGVLLSFWLVLFIYMGFSLFQLVDESQKSTNQLQRANEELDILKRENNRLRTEHVSQDINRISNNINGQNIMLNSDQARFQRDVRRLSHISSGRDQTLEDMKTGPGPSAACEKLRRRVDKDVQEIWYYISSELTKLEKLNPTDINNKIKVMLDEFSTHHSFTQIDLENLANCDNAISFKQRQHMQLSAVVQKRLRHLQNPKDCSKARKLVCSLNKGCGYGCQMHHILYCFIVAYASKRTLVIDSSGWRYSYKGWDKFFLPVSTSCTDIPPTTLDWSSATEGNLAVRLPIVDSLYPRPKQMPLAVPSDMAPVLSRFHGHPFVWWIGQFSSYLFRFQPDLKEHIDKKKERMEFASPIVGVQIRRTDKINLEAAFHSLKEYMYWVEIYYKKLSLKQKVDKKRVFLATDDDKVLAEAQKTYKDYHFLSDNDVSKSASLNSRYTEESLYGVISDIEMLSETDFLVCTFSSQVCRLAYEIMNSKHADASNKFQSLDDVYYFGGQTGHDLMAIHPHKPQHQGEIEMGVGDLLGIAGNHWDGYSKAHSHKYDTDGLFPSYKAEEVVDVVEFPDYTDADAS